MRRQTVKARKLGELELLRRCRKRDLEVLASIADDVTYAPGDVLCRQGQLGYEWFVLTAGEAEVRVHDQPVATVGPGDVVGEMSILDGGPRTASVVALTDVHAFCIDRRRFDALLERAPAIARAMLRQLSLRLRRADELSATAPDGV